MFNSKDTVLDLETTTKRGFVFKSTSAYKGGDYLAVVIINQKTGKQLATYDLDMSLIDDVKGIKTLGALIKFAKTAEVA